MRPEVSIIIPTLGAPEREEMLHRAVDSVLDQSGVHAVPIVVLNGDRRSREVERRLRLNPCIQLISLDTASLPAALLAGREAVTMPWFGTLDDDDMLLDGALERRIHALATRPDRDVVVSDGYVQRAGVRVLGVGERFDVAGNPLQALLRRNWLLPGAWLARSDSVGVELFRGMPRYGECTFLAVKFAVSHRMLWLNEPTVVYHVGSPLAESRTAGYVHGQVDALHSILSLPMPDDVASEFRARIANAHHAAAEHDLMRGELGAAWRAHVASLRSPGGWRFLPYTRHLLWSLLRPHAADATEPPPATEIVVP